MPLSPLEYLRHILDETAFLIERSSALTKDRLIHDYFGVDYDIVWDVVVTKIPALRLEVQRILDSDKG